MTKFRNLGAVLIPFALMACSQAEETPEISLPENVIVATFIENDDPEVTPDVCNPVVRLEMKTDQFDSLRVNTNFNLDGSSLMGFGQAMIPKETEGVIELESPISLFKPYEKPCSETDIRVHEFTCRSSASDHENIDCPEVEFHGTEMFMAFRGLPQY